MKSSSVVHFSEFNLWTWVYLLTYLRKIYFCSTLKLVKNDDCDLGWWWGIAEENGVVIEIWSMTQPTIHPPALSHTFHILQNSEIQSSIVSSSESEKEQWISNEMLRGEKIHFNVKTALKKLTWFVYWWQSPETWFGNGFVEGDIVFPVRSPHTKQIYIIFLWILHIYKELSLCNGIIIKTSM